MERLSMDGITKVFGGITALSAVHLSANAGEVHALMGENGAGKSTLMKVLSGAYSHQGGEIRIDGQHASIHSPYEAMKQGVSIIYQEFSLASHMTVAENILMHELGRKFGINYHKINEKAARLLSEIGFEDIRPTQIVGTLSVAYQQVVEICKALSTDCKILVLDEPTAVLTNHETEKLFCLVKKLRDEGVCIIYISHRLDEIFELCDRVTILKDGTTVGTWPVGELDHDSLTNLMIGRELSEFFPKRNADIGAVALEVQNLRAGTMVADVSFSVRAGEVLGIGGLVGAGRTEALRAIFGVDARDGGVVRLHGQEVSFDSAGQSVRNRVGLLPEDRKHQGVLLDMSISENALMTPVNPFINMLGWIDRSGERRKVQELWEGLRLKASSQSAPVSSLSGGNQQKVALMKWLVANCDVLFLDEPTRGVDVGAKVEIYRVINELAERGVAIVMVSSEMIELIGMCDRVAVMRAGRVTGTLEGTDMTENNIIELAMGRDNVH